MMQKFISLKVAGFLLSVTMLAFSCVKKNSFDFTDGTPGDGEADQSITVDTSIKFVDVSKYAQARTFPGLVCGTEPRLMDYHLIMDLNYNAVGEDLRISVAPQPQFSTGLYAIYQQRGAAFVDDYRQLLASTGEANAADLAARFGIDLRSRAFWEDSLAVIGKQIDRYCEIIEGWGS